MNNVLIENGILKSLRNKDIKIVEHLIPEANQTSRPGYELVPESITIHNTANPNASAEANSIYVDSTDKYLSWHLTVGNNVVYQELPFNEVSWHAGDGPDGKGNRTSISIEIAEVDGAYETAIEVVRDLCAAFKFDPYNDVVPHKHWSGKECPRLILPIWNDFIEEIATPQEDTVDKINPILLRRLRDLARYSLFYRRKDKNEEPNDSMKNRGFIAYILSKFLK